MKSLKRLPVAIGMMIVLLLGSLFVGVSQTTYATESDTYYATWDAYSEAGGSSNTWNEIADAMDDVFDYGVTLFAAGDRDGAYKVVNDGYYGWYETTGFERNVNGFISGSRVTQVELQFKNCKNIATNGTQEEFETEIANLKALIHTDANQLDGVPDDGSGDSGDASDGEASTSASVLYFGAAFGIILREGFEAILIVGAIIAYLRKSEEGNKLAQRKKVLPAYVGSVIGIGASFVLAWLLSLLNLADSAHQEIIEGITALLAVCVLYYVSNWMLSKSETDAWVSYLQKKGAGGSSGKLGIISMAFTCFLAVFREGAEVVLFYQPYMTGDYVSSVWAGFIVGCVCLVFIFLAIHFLSIKIPTKPFFTATSILMFLMSISFLGAGIKELIEGDLISMTSPAWLQWIPLNDTLDMLGIYPVLETLIPQLILLIISAVLFIWQTKKNRKIHAEAEAKRAEERALKEAEEKRRQEEEFRRQVTAIVDEVLTARLGDQPVLQSAKEKVES